MPWPLRKIEIAHADRDDKGVEWWVDAATRERPKVGDCFYAPQFLHDPLRASLAPRYWLTWSKTRLPIVIVLPSGEWWCVDEMAHDRNGHHGEGWTVTGSIDTTPITLSCTPSINAVGRYHGFLTNGVITDDVEGRRFT